VQGVSQKVRKMLCAKYVHDQRRFELTIHLNMTTDFNPTLLNANHWPSVVNASATTEVLHQFL
jgi:hypothetical protein